MNLLEQIRNWRQGETSEKAEDPLPRFMTVWKRVQERRREVMVRCGISWAELIIEARKIDPALTDAVLAQWDEINTDIYGRYTEGKLTCRMLQDYCRKLDEWKRLSFQMFNLIAVPK